jgi:hypothetical protein
MELPRPIANLIDHANSIDNSGNERIFTMEVTVVTPTDQIPMILPSGFARLSAFATKLSDDARVIGQLQPGVYNDSVLPYKDNLYIEIVEREGMNQVMRRFRATPMGDANPAQQGGNTALANLASKDDINMISVTFQIFEVGFALLKNELIADVHLMTNLKDVLHYQLTKYGKMLELTGGDAFRGVDIEDPIDNDRIFKQVAIAPPIPLIRLGQWLQAHDEFGIYSTGLGMYYRKGMWYIYPLHRMGRYEKARKVLDVYRLPENVIPTLKNSYFVNGRTVTVLSTGGGNTKDGRDIDRQNKGTGKRVISSDAVMGEVGRYYNKGQALTTRQDSLSEYQTAKRASGEEMIPFHASPTNNLCKVLSENALNDNTDIVVEWHNSYGLLIEPGMPCRFFYMNGNNALMYKEGTVQHIKTEYRMDTESAGHPVFREHSAIGLSISKEEMSAE